MIATVLRGLYDHAQVAQESENPTPAESEAREEFRGNLRDIVRQIESCGFQCEAGPIENNVAFQVLKEMAEAEQSAAGN